MPYIPARCDTLLIPSGPSEHLFVITTDACPMGSHLLVNFSSVKAGRTIDSTCIIEPGEHPFIGHRSFVLYRSAQIQTANRLSTLVDGWLYKPHERATSELTDRILSGFSVSPFTPNFIKSYLRQARAD